MGFRIILVDPNGLTKLYLRLGELSLVDQKMPESVSCFLIVRIELHGFLKRHKGFLPIFLQARHALLIITLGLLFRFFRRRAAAQEQNDDGHGGHGWDDPERTRSQDGHEMSSKWVSCL